MNVALLSSAQVTFTRLEASAGAGGRKLKAHVLLIAAPSSLLLLDRLNTYHRSPFFSVSPNFSSRSRFHCPMNFPIIAAHYASPLSRHSILYWSFPVKGAIVNLAAAL